eukprot:snap_masked-scaffold_22-processed-gene-4.42-mRNA-1 protein AED:1.00 eAED:1.00 QI:0/0/0/0/1/1/2/0/320
MRKYKERRDSIASSVTSAVANIKLRSSAIIERLKYSAGPELKERAEKARQRIQNVNSFFNKPISKEGFDILNKRTLYSEDSFEDFKKYWRNHSLPFSACFQDEENPVRKRDKMTFFFSGVLFSLFLTCILEGDLYSSGGKGRGELSAFEVSVIIGASDYLYTNILGYIGLCSCYLGGNTIEEERVKQMRTNGSRVLMLFFILSLALAIYGVVFLIKTDQEEIRSEYEYIVFSGLRLAPWVLLRFLVALIFARVVDFIVLMIMFWYKRIKEVRKVKKHCEDEDYVDDNELEEALIEEAAKKFMEKLFENLAKVLIYKYFYF